MFHAKSMQNDICRKVAKSLSILEAESYEGILCLAGGNSLI